MNETVTSLLNVIIADPHIEKYEPAEKFNVPSVESLSLTQFDFASDATRLVYVHSLESLYEILALPYIVDRFTNSASRDTWILNMYKSFGREIQPLLYDNALRPANLALVKNRLSQMKMYGLVSSTTEWADRYKQLLDEIDYLSFEDNINYRTLNKEDQVEHIKKLKLAIVELLLHLVREG